MNMLNPDPLNSSRPSSLTTADVQAIRQRIDVDPELTLEELAREYKVSPTAIRLIALGKTWKHVTPSCCINYPRPRGNRPGITIQATRALTEGQAAMLKKEYAERRGSMRQLARKYGICAATVYNYVKGVRK